jgi:hypothetical protein
LAVLLNETKNISHQPFMLRQFIFKRSRRSYQRGDAIFESPKSFDQKWLEAESVLLR